MEEKKKIILKRVNKNKGFIFLMILFSILSSVSVSNFLNVPEYQASAQILIGGERQHTYLDKYIIQDEMRFLDTYSEIIKSPLILGIVKDRTGNNLSIKELRENTSVDYIENSQVFDLSFQHEDPQTAVLLVNEIATVFSKEAGKVMNANSITLLSMADPAEEETIVGFRPEMKLLLALFAGLSAAIGLVLILPELNTTVTTNQEVDELLEVPVLGNISPIKSSRNRHLRQKKHIRSV